MIPEKFSCEVVAVIAADVSQEITETQAIPSSDSESQGGETDAPANEKQVSSL